MNTRPRIIGVNGIHSHGENSTDIVLSILRDSYGYEVLDFNYKPVSFLRALSRKKQLDIGEKLAREARVGDAVVAHSFGCLVTLRAMECSAMFSQVMFLSAAMHPDFTFPHHGMMQLINLYNPADIALWAAVRARWGDLGGMGRVGYSGPTDSRICQREEYFNESCTTNHMHYFSQDNAPRIAAIMHEEIEALRNGRH